MQDVHLYLCLSDVSVKVPVTSLTCRRTPVEWPAKSTQAKVWKRTIMMTPMRRQKAAAWREVAMSREGMQSLSMASVEAYMAAVWQLTEWQKSWLSTAAGRKVTHMEAYQVGVQETAESDKGE